ncbi:response regulator [Alcanivorax sp. JB21]|uniref:response regulator transcription factor n=1 Tax=Alcanivorax limicola TaxID=2874102 RepID=UPI001CBC6965|nr:response regulator [Alcanivorax limicola]MBZ2189362.1 response regulator [Alcanivorax limicola]
MTAGQILLVEDDPLVGELLDYLLKREGFGVLWARDGRAAQRAIAESDGFIAAILDVMLPYVDGYSLVEQLREHTALSDIPVLMLTARAQEQDVVRALELGADDYLVKPFQPGELTARLRRLIRRRPR